MIEAVNSVISNVQAARTAVASQASTLDSFAADQSAIESVARAPVAPYISPFVSVDVNFDTAVLQIRDSDTGDVLTQFPSEPTLQQRQAQAASQEIARQETRELVAPETQQVSEPAPQVNSVPQSTFQATVIAQETQALQSSTAGAAQAAVAALSAGAQSGIGSASTTTTTTTA